LTDGGKGFLCQTKVGNDWNVYIKSMCLSYLRKRNEILQDANWIERKLFEMLVRIFVYF
jgi:hypothetical protein